MHRPLHIAVLFSDVETVMFLIEIGAKIDPKNQVTLKPIILYST